MRQSLGRKFSIKSLEGLFFLWQKNPFGLEYRQYLVAFTLIEIQDELLEYTYPARLLTPSGDLLEQNSTGRLALP